MYKRQIFERYLRESEERQLLATVRRVDCVLAKRDAAWMLLMRNTGVRVCVVAGLTVADARDALCTQYLKIRAEINKGDSSHRLLVTKQIATTLQELLRIRKRMGHAEHPDAPLVMSRQLGKGLSIRSMQHRMRHWVKAAGLPVAASPHWWRHTLAKRAMAASESSNPQAVVQHLLGHKHRASTEIYTQPDRDDIEETLRAAQH